MTIPQGEPESIAKIINDTVYFAIDDVDEIQLTRYQYALENIRKQRPFNDEEYVAASKVNFNLKKYQQAFDILEEGLALFHSWRILEAIGICKLALSHQDRSYTFDVRSDWFEHPLYPQQRNFCVRFIVDEIEIAGQNTPLEKRVLGRISISKDLRCVINWGPFQLHISYEDLEEDRLHPVPRLMEYIGEEILFTNLRQEEQGFLISVFGQENYAAFVSELRIGVIEVPLSGGINENVEIVEPITARIIRGKEFVYFAVPDIEFVDGEFYDQERFDESDVMAWAMESLGHHIEGYRDAYVPHMSERSLEVRDNVLKYFAIR